MLQEVKQMRVMDMSAEPSEYSIVVCLHGDEIGPKIGVDNLVKSGVISGLPVKYVVANEKAISEGQRYVDEDLNRAFCEETSETHESQLAQSILTEVRDTKVIDLHTTYASREPFIVIGQLNDEIKNLARATGLDRVVDQSNYATGGLIQYVDGISVECGLIDDCQSIVNSKDITQRILRYAGYLSGDEVWSDPIVYEVYDTISRPAGNTIEIIADNFSEVNVGDVVYKHAGEEVTASEKFWPVLLAAKGYNDILGFKSRRQGNLSSYEC